MSTAPHFWMGSLTIIVWYSTEEFLCLKLINFVAGICVFIVLPLTLLRNLESLFAVSTASIIFYVLVMLHIVASARSESVHIAPEAVGDLNISNYELILASMYL